MSQRGNGRGASNLHNVPSRVQSASSSVTASAAASTASATSQNPPAVVPMVVPPRRPKPYWPVVQQCQEFIVQLAWREVRESATMTVAHQKDAILSAYSRWVPLFLDGQIPAENASYPAVPQSLSECDRNEAISVLHYSTGTGGANLSKDALHRKAKSGVKKLLKYMGNWVSVCKDGNTNSGDFTPSAPPSGKDRDWVWLQIKKTEHRIAQCLKIYKLRTENRHLPENTADAIKESLTHLIFARRGRSLEEEMELRGMAQSDDFSSRSTAFQREEESHLRGELSGIFEEVAAGYCTSEDDEPDQNRAARTTSTASASRPTANVPRTYFEVPYADHTHHVHEFTFKAFTQYAGHGHATIAQFYTTEWADQCRTQASSGGTGRAHQRARQLHSQQASQRESQSTPPPNGAALPDSQSAVAGLQSHSVNQLAEIGRHMQVSNSVAQAQVQISNLEKAVALANKLGKAPAAVVQLEECLFGEYLRSVGTTVPSHVVQSLTATLVAAQATSATDIASIIRSPPKSRRRGNDEDTERPLSAWEKAQNDIVNKFSITDNEGQGNCLFIVLSELWNQYRVFINRCYSATEKTHQQARAFVVAKLRQKAHAIRLGKAVPVVTNDSGDQSFDVLASDGMIQQKGSIEAYCDWMAHDGISGRFAGFVCEVLSFMPYALQIVKSKLLHLSMTTTSSSMCTGPYSRRTSRAITKFKCTRAKRLTSASKIHLFSILCIMFVKSLQQTVATMLGQSHSSFEQTDNHQPC
jgi:hypothetical protein